ncbi:MAG TPA: NAD(P)/FAD-dependent oxidoreductase [Gemmatimonadaceae bacterium]|nr:NAD(P)/FAD-dependent oxidoreductase [Gemmatimonadaceae bacterium]
MSRTPLDAIVIGAGANGLAAATTLGRAGRRVLLLDSGDAPGGLARAVEFAPGFHASPLGLDAGWLPPAVARGMGMGIGDLADTEPAIGAAVATSSGEIVSLSCDPRVAAERIRQFSPRDAGRWPEFVARLRALAGFLEAMYQLPPPDLDAELSLGELGPLLGLGRKFRSLGRDDMTELLRVLPMSVHDLADEWFESDTLKTAIAAAGIRDIRQGPRSGGTSFVLLHHLVGAPAGSIRARGWWREGPDVFTVTAEALARKAKVGIRMNAPVERITVEDDAVTGVVLVGGEEIKAKTVISTADPARTLLGLIDPVWLDPEFLHAVRQIKFRGSTAFVMYALDALPEMPGLADARAALASMVTLSTSTEALERGYDAAKYGTISDKLHVEITVPSLRWPNLAPEGKHVLVARAQYTPHTLRNGATWDDAQSSLINDCVTSIIGRAMPKLADHIVARTLVSPVDLETKYGLTEGAVTHGELTLDQILFMRPVAGWGRYAMPIDGLYLGGAGAHPGPGILGGPGWLAAKRALAK